MKEDIRKLLSASPGLLGREIAKSLAGDKSKINRFLHKNRDDFRQDDDYRWYLANPDEAVIEFSSGWVDSQLFEKSLSEYEDLYSSDHSAVKFVIPKGCKFLLVAIAKLLAVANQLAARGIAVSIDVSECGDTRNFFNRAGFFDSLADGVDVFPVRPNESAAKKYKGNSNSLVEFGAISPQYEAEGVGENKSLALALGNSFVSKSSDQYRVAAFTMFSELVGNVSRHSESPIDGFAALQFYSPPHKANHIQTVVSDSGLGVSRTLRPSLEQNYPKLHARFGGDTIESDIGLVKETFSKGNVSRFGAGNGLGFKSTREQATKFDADLSIRQETFNIELSYRGGLLTATRVDKGLSRIYGTHICFDFMVD